MDGWGKVTLLQGPPGSGKTTLLRLCHDALLAEALPACWLSLDKDDADPVVLRHHLATALAAGNEGQAAAQLLVPGGTTLFIDCIEALRDSPAMDALEQFLLSVPADGRVLASGLALRSAAMHDGRLRGLVRVLGPDALRLADDEAAMLLGHGCDLATAAHVNRFVGGWAAGVRVFAAHIANGNSPLPGKALRLPAELADYLADVVCTQIPAGDLQVLRQLAVLERFNAGLLAALPAPPCDWQWAEGLAREGRLLYFTSGARDWVGMTPAFALFLRERLRLAEPARHRQLQVACIEWLAGNGFKAEAMRHAMAVEDRTLATGLIERMGAIAVDLEDGPNAPLGSEVAVEDAGELPLLFLSQTYQRIRHGQHPAAAHDFRQAWRVTEGFTRLRSDVDPVETGAYARMLQMVFQTADDLPVGDEQWQALEADLQRYLVRSPTLAGSIASILVHLHADGMRFPDAVAIAANGLAAQPTPHASKAAMWVRLQQAAALLGHGSIEQALASSDEALRLTGLDGGPASYEVLANRLVRGIALYEDDQADAALALLQPALAQIRGVNGWVRLYAESFAAAAAIAGRREGWDAAERVIRAGEEFALERNLPRLRMHLQVARMRELTRAGERALAMRILEGDVLHGLLHSPDERPYVRTQQLVARLAGAELLLQLSKPQAAAELLCVGEDDLFEPADQRWRMQFHSLAARAMFALRRGPAACAHLQAAVELDRLAGLRRIAREQAAHLVQVHDAHRNNSRAIPALTTRHVDLVLRPLAGELPPAETTPRAASGAVLSRRESEIISLMAAGCINKEIAARLGISEGTVKTHRKKIHEKLGAANRSQAIQRARELMII